MLATIIKSPMAVRTTIEIIETYAKIKDLSRNIKELPNVKNKGNMKVDSIDHIVFTVKNISETCEFY